jgi:hypothetical protein
MKKEKRHTHMLHCKEEKDGAGIPSCRTTTPPTPLLKRNIYLVDYDVEIEAICLFNRGNTPKHDNSSATSNRKPKSCETNARFGTRY